MQVLTAKIRLNVGILFLAMFVLSSCATQKLVKDKVLHILDKTASWQIDNFKYSTEGSPGFLHDYGIDAWTNSVFYMGLFDWAEVSNNQAYFDWLYQIGEKNNWQVANNFETYKSIGKYHADEMTIGNFYAAMFNQFSEQTMVDELENRIEYIINNPPDKSMKSNNKQRWTWCDALFMAPPVYASMASINGNKHYLTYMHNEFLATYNHLFDKETGLYFRDDSYFEKREANGEKIFWGRGNGWVVAGVANLLKKLPADSELRPFYEKIFKSHIDSLLKYRDENGFWHASLLDPESYPSPETSATALITYALAYGVNSGLLKKSEYLSDVKKSWHALTSVVNENGALGYVQPIGADPRKVTKEMTAVYGIGAFLMAGSEVYKLSK